MVAVGAARGADNLWLAGPFYADLTGVVLRQK
jgi:hypothetical protein